MTSDIINTANNDILSSDAPKTTADNERENESKKEEEHNLTEFEEMFKAGAHFAYSRTKRHPKMSQYIYGVKNNAEFFDLEKTKESLENAIQFLRDLKNEDEKGLILFVGTKPGIEQIISKAAGNLEMPYVANRWLGGTLTNFKVLRNRVLRFEKLQKDIESGELEKYTKKEKIKINKEYDKMRKIFSGLEKLAGLPSVLIIVDPKEESTAVREARRLSIPIIAVLNNDCEPTYINYPIPANDSAPKSVEYIISKLVSGYKDESLNLEK